jgi:hypothetical protein
LKLILKLFRIAIALVAVDIFGYAIMLRYKRYL